MTTPASNHAAFVGIFVGLILLLGGCATKSGPGLPGIAAFGADSTFEVITWNIENFGRDEPPVEMVAHIIAGLDADIMGLQELVSQAAFDSVLQRLPGWKGVRAKTDSRMQELAWLWQPDHLDSVGPAFEIYLDADTAFPREPLVLPVVQNGLTIYLINNHFKCCGNGSIGSWPDDEEARRQRASELLEEYIRSLPEGTAAVLLGDLNDEIDEPQAKNVFWNFLEDEWDFAFVTRDLAADSASASYPIAPWNNTIDHILITSELFAGFEHSGHAETIRLDDVVDDYLQSVSDHRPVGMRLQIEGRLSP